jgi:hypothetical protein
MTSYGITASQSGIDISQATDAQRSIDARWRYLDVLFDEKVTIPNIATKVGRTNVFRHGLGFLPAFDFYSVKNNNYLETFVYSDKEYIYFDSNAFDIAGISGSTGIIKIYNIPITEEYIAPIAQTLSRGKSKPSNYGMKVLDPNKSGDMKSNEMSDFTLNTDAKALAVHMTGTQKVSSILVNKIVIRHNLGNPPIFMAAKCGDEFVQPITPDFMSVIADSNINEQTLVFRGAQAILTGSYAYIIFKEFADFVQ